jgi:hypothetical protein
MWFNFGFTYAPIVRIAIATSTHSFDFSNEKNLDLNQVEPVKFPHFI